MALNNAGSYIDEIEKIKEECKNKEFENASFTYNDVPPTTVKLLASHYDSRLQPATEQIKHCWTFIRIAHVNDKFLLFKINGKISE